MRSTWLVIAWFTLATNACARSGFDVDPRSLVEAPLALVYPRSGLVTLVGVEVPPQIPTYRGGVAAFSVTPTLPDAIELNENNGVIAGVAPDGPWGPGSFTIRAENASGFVEAVVTLEVLPGYVVNNEADQGEPTGNNGDGFCSTEVSPEDSSSCTLRAAVEETEADVGKEIILILDGTYVVTSELFIDDPVHIQGESRDGVILSGGGASRLIEFGSGSFSMRSFTIRDGYREVGGGMRANSNTTLSLSDCRFLDNEATTDGGGAIIAVEAATLEVDSCSFVNNRAPNGSGGAIRTHEDGTLRVANCDFLSNSASSAGAIAAQRWGASASTIVTSYFYNNRSTSGPSAIAMAGLLDSCTLDVNIGIGAAIDAVGDMDIVNSTLTNSEATGKGGAVFTNQSDVRLLNSLVMFNHTTYQGGGVGGHSGGTYLLKNSIVVQNSADTTHKDCIGSQTLSEGWNLVGSTCSPGVNDLTDVDPMLSTGQYAQLGPVPVYLPLSNSPLIDAGAADECPAFDALGSARPRDGDGDGSSRCDIGPVER